MLKSTEMNEHIDYEKFPAKLIQFIIKKKK